MPQPKSVKLSLPHPKDTLYLLDISSFIFRAFFAIRALHNKKGEPTNAVYGVATMLARLAEEASPENLVVAYDSPEPSFREEIYKDYKANRTEPPDDLVPQFDRIEALIEAFDIHAYRMGGWEADDIIATLTKRWSEKGPEKRVVIVSSDKDLMQLVSDQVCIWDTMSNRIYQTEDVIEKFGVRPNQIRDYLALVGDTSDNIPGVRGIGPKGASELLREYSDLAGVLQAAQDGKIKGKKGETLVENRSNALLSAKLATIKTDLKLKLSEESLQYRFHVSPRCEELLKELDFHSLVTRWKKATESQEQAKESLSNQLESQSHLKTITEKKQLEALLRSIDQSGQMAIDLETTSLNPREAKIVGIALCENSKEAFYIPIGHKHSSEKQLDSVWVLDTLRPYFENPKIKKIGQNLKYDWSVLIENGFRPQGLAIDTMIAAYLVDPDSRHNLTMLASRYLDYKMLSYEDVCGKGKDQISFDQVDIEIATRYSAEDVWIAICLWEKLKVHLKTEKLEKLFSDLEMPLVHVLTEMELQGVCIDKGWFEKLSKDFAKELAEIQERIHAHSNEEINLNSTKQLSKLLFEELKLPVQSKTKTGYSTDSRVLEALAPLHEVPRMLLEYRELSKLKNTYVDPIPLLADPKTGKIHTSFHQTVAATGRLSSSEPNLQNIPIRSERGLLIRRGFVSSPGNILFSADYSQVELRILAHMSEDPVLIDSFRKEEDVHRRTASDLFAVEPAEVSNEQRAIAKAINFGLMYGKTPFGLSQELKIPRKKAQEIIDRYFSRYVRVKEFLDQQVEDAREKGYVLSILGRKRKLPDIHSKNPAIRNNAERMAMNTPIQGTAADLIKLAMISMGKKFKEKDLKSKLIIQVHDELVFDCKKEELEVVSQTVIDVMENALKLRVPLRVNTASGENWMDL